MRLSSALVLTLALVSVPVAAQTVSKPGAITPPITSTTTLTEPLVVSASGSPVGAIVGVNSNGLEPGESAGVVGSGTTGLRGEGVLGLYAVGTRGIEANGIRRGIDTACWDGPCTALSAIGYGWGSYGVYGRGGAGIVGEAYSPDGKSQGLAGYFIGAVSVSGNLFVTGTITSPVITQLTAQIAALTARLDSLSAPSAMTLHIDAADYIAFSDSTPGNEGGVYRQDDVDIKANAEGGYTVGWMTAGEWLEYPVTIPASGVYAVSLRTGSLFPDRTVLVSIDGAAAIQVQIPVIANWDGLITTVSGTLPALTPGRHLLRVTVGASDFLDLAWLELTRTAGAQGLQRPTN